MKLSNGEYITDKYLELTDIRVLDTKRTVFVRDGKLNVESTLPSNDNSPYFTLGEADDKSKKSKAKSNPTYLSRKINDVKLYRSYPVKGTTKDKTEDIIKIAQKMEGSDRKLVGSHIATTYGYTNFNDRYYHPDSIDANAKTFYQPNPIPFMYDHDKYDSRKVIGRVFHAESITYDIPKNKINDALTPKAAIKVYSIITDQDAIDGIMDERYLTISSGFKARRDAVECSACGAPLSDQCEHVMSGEDDDGKPIYLVFHDMRYNDISYVTSPADLFSKNENYTIVTGDAWNDNGKINENTIKEMQSNNMVEKLDNSDYSLYLVDNKSKTTMVDLVDLEEKKFNDIFGNKWKCTGDICTLDNSSEDEINDSQNTDNNTTDEKENKGTQNVEQNDNDNDKINSEDKNNEDNDDCPCSSNDEQVDNTENNASPEEDEMSMIVANLDIIKSLLDSGSIKSEDAFNMLREAKIPIINVMKYNKDGDEVYPSENHLSNIITDCLDNIFNDDSCDDLEDEKSITKNYPLPDKSHAIDALARAKENASPSQYKKIKACVCSKSKENDWDLPTCKKNGDDNEDKKLTTKARKKLSKSTFCGPDRSFPVPDCAHYTAALRLLSRYKGSGSKSKIRACIERKGKALGCTGAKKNNNK